MFAIDGWLPASSTPPRVCLANPIRGCRKHPGQHAPTTPALERAGLRKLSPPELHARLPAQPARKHPDYHKAEPVALAAPSP